MAVYALGSKAPLIDNSCFVADEATLIGDVILKEKSSVWPQAVLRGDSEPITIGAGSNVQDGAVLHTDPGYPLSVADQVTIGHQAMLHGCTIGSGSLIGIQAVILNGAVIGKNCLVGAGALITEGTAFPDNSLILGTPAKVVKTLTDEACRGIHANTQTYIDKAALYKKELKKIG